MRDVQERLYQSIIETGRIELSLRRTTSEVGAQVVSASRNPIEWTEPVLVRPLV